MKFQLTTLFLIWSISLNSVFAQKNDYNWPLGFAPNKSETRILYNFNTDTPTIVIRADTVSTGVYTAAFSDNNGALLFFSNGLRIFDKNGSTVENSEGLNPTIEEWQQQLSYQGQQSGFFLENPGNPDLLYFISLDFGEHPAQNWPYTFVGENLLVTTIDVAANNGSGKVIEKNKKLLTGTLMSPAACRHANGRDWWILVSNADENLHYRILLTPDGFSDPETQAIGTKPSPLEIGSNIVGNCFSPQGNYYVDAHDQLGFSIFSFNRCSGMLSNEKRYDYPAPEIPGYLRYSYGYGAVFSPDEKLFYKTTKYSSSPASWAVLGSVPYLFQFDLQAADLATSLDTINIIDPNDYWPTIVNFDGFYGAELGPDGRIYIVRKNNSFCSVQYPNVRGRGCTFLYDKPVLGNIIKGQGIPYMPNYRLGPMDGSTCDTLGINNLPVAEYRTDVVDTAQVYARYFYDLSHHNPAIWLWDFGDGSTSQDTSPVHLFPGDGVYQVCLTVSNQFASNTICKEVAIGSVSAKEAPEEALFALHPNPANGVVYWKKGGEQAVKVRVLNLLGQVFLETTTQENQLNMAGIPAGIYLLEFQVGTIRYLRKLVKA